MTHDISIVSTGPHQAKIFIDDQDVANMVTRCEIDIGTNGLPTVVLTLLPRSLQVTGLQAEVQTRQYGEVTT